SVSVSVSVSDSGHFIEYLPPVFSNTIFCEKFFDLMLEKKKTAPILLSGQREYADRVFRPRACPEWKA
ncbi:hypothetical protein, partial [Yersinia pseudotuberculosis]|uniref:hypothetical protein n=1 Tax=Yersinia pseudotuberculosis TaxID=633 RepID=UPI001C62CB13